MIELASWKSIDVRTPIVHLTRAWFRTTQPSVELWLSILDAIFATGALLGASTRFINLNKGDCSNPLKDFLTWVVWTQSTLIPSNSLLGKLEWTAELLSVDQLYPCWSQCCRTHCSTCCISSPLWSPELEETHDEDVVEENKTHEDD